jgi:hypothetical protein
MVIDDSETRFPGNGGAGGSACMRRLWQARRVVQQPRPPFGALARFYVGI